MMSHGDPNAIVQPLDLADRGVQPDDVFGNPGAKPLDKSDHAAVKPPSGRIHWIAGNGFGMAAPCLEPAHACFKLGIPLKAQCLYQRVYFRVDYRPIPGWSQIGEKTLMLRA